MLASTAGERVPRNGVEDHDRASGRTLGTRSERMARTECSSSTAFRKVYVGVPEGSPARRRVVRRLREPLSILALTSDHGQIHYFSRHLCAPFILKTEKLKVFLCHCNSSDQLLSNLCKRETLYIGRVFSTLTCSYSHHQYTTVHMCVTDSDMDPNRNM